MELTPATIDAINYSFNTLFQAGYTVADTWYQQIAMAVPSTGRENRYAWMDKIPTLRKWLGERYIQNVSSRGMVLKNDDYELTIEVERNDILDDQIGVYSPISSSIGQQAKKWPDYVVGDAMPLGKTSILAFDGQPFFNASHPIDPDGQVSGTYSNLTTAFGLTPANYQTMRQGMLGYLGRDGRPLGITPNLLIHPPQLEAQAKQIVEQEWIAPAAALGANSSGVVQGNPLRGTAKRLMVPQLAAEPLVWYLADTTKPVMPMVWQLRQAPNQVSLVNPTDPNLFNRKKFVWGVDGRGAAGFSLPFLMARCEG